jgi:hypothetical protein
MSKLVRYGLLLLVVSMIGLSLFVISPQAVYATEEEIELEQAAEFEYTEAERTSAIVAANNAILRIPRASQIVSLDQVAITLIAEARALVEHAKEYYHAEDKDFPSLSKLVEAENIVLKLLAVRAAQDAIDALPPISLITEEDRAAVEEARRLVDIAMVVHGATRFDICWRLDLLIDIEDKFDDVEPEPEPTPPPKPDDRIPTPPTGGMPGLIAMGLLLSGAGMLFVKQRKGRH